MLTLKFILRNLLRHKLRTFLTILGIVISVLAFGILRTVVDAWYAGVEASSATRLVTRNSISLIFSMPLAYKEKIRQTSGVTMVAAGNWFGGIYIDEKNFFPNFAVEAGNYLDLYPEFVLPEKDKSAFLKDRKGMIAGRKLAERFKWKIGDVISLKSQIFPGYGTWDMVLRGIYKGARKDTDEGTAFFHWDYLNETMKKTEPHRANEAGFYVVGIKSADLAGDVAKSIDASFRNSNAETLTETEKAFQMGFIAMSSAIVTAIELISFLVIGIIMAVAANTMAMSARERLGEFATLKTMGFAKGYLVLIIAGESMAVSMLGTLIGALMTFPAAGAFGKSLEQFFPVFLVSRETIILQIASGILVGAVAAVFPSVRAQGVKIAQALRKVG